MTLDTLPDPQRLSGLVALDLETCDPWIATHGPGWAAAGRIGDAAGYVVGCAVAWRDEARQTHGRYIAWRTPEGQHTEHAFAHRAWVRDLLGNAQVRVVCHNAPYDLGWLTEVEGMPWPERHADTMVYAALLDEHRRSYALNAVAPEWLGAHRVKDESALVAYAKQHKLHPKKDLYRMPTELVAPYAREDARLTLDLLHAMVPRVRAEIPEPLRRLEHDVQRVLVRMRAQGIRLDLDHIERSRVAMREEAARIKTTMLRGARPTAARDLEKLFATEGIVPDRTRTDEPSITKAWLKQQDSDTARALLRVRWLEKQEGTFLAGIAARAVNGRIHGELHGLRSDDGGTVSGRLSSSKPNLQNLSAKADPEHIVRRSFLPEVGEQWTCLDYSGQEARIAVHIASGQALPDAYALARGYRENPRLDLYAALRDNVNAMLDGTHAITRDQAKVLFLAAMYGMGDAKCCSMLGIPLDVALLVLVAFRTGAPWVTTIKQRLEASARVDGYTTTMYDRRARYRPVPTPHGTPTTFNARDRRYSAHVSLNRVVQGSAADQVKLALVALYRDGVTPLVTVHDEIDLSTAGPETARRAAAIMADVLPMRVPMVIDIAMGDSWGAAEEVDTFVGGATDGC